MDEEKSGGGAKGYLIKLLSGPHSGAEVEMDAKDAHLCIGNGDEADLILSDALVSPKHAEITLREGQLFINPLEGRVFLDGHPIDGETVIGNFQFLTIGTSHLVSGPSNEEWPAINVANAPALDHLAQEVPQGTVGESDLATDPGLLRLAREQAAKSAKKKRRKYIFIGVALLVSVLAIISFFQPREKKVSPQELEKILRAQVADMGYSSAVSVHLDRGQISAEGLVATNLELRDLRNTLMETYSGIHFQVRSGERICEAIEEILGEMETKLRVVNLQPGVYSVVGYVSNVDKWQKILPRIATDVPGVKKFQNDVTTPEKVITTSQALLNQYGFGRSVAVIPEAGRILYQGKISVLQAEQWKKAVEDLIQAFGDLVAMEFDVQTHSAQTETTNTGFFPQPIQSITISSSGLSWIVTSDGKKYFIGSFLPSGWRVDAIAIDGLSLSRDGKQVTMHLEALK